jgi:hypothetical protein
MTDNTKELMIAAAGIVGILAILTAVVVGSAHMESRTFNKLTGADTTWVDAVFVELRVQEAPL